MRKQGAEIKLHTLMSLFGENAVDVGEALKAAVWECRSLGMPEKDLSEATQLLIAAKLERCSCGDCKSCVGSMNLAELRFKLHAHEAACTLQRMKRKSEMLEA